MRALLIFSINFFYKEWFYIETKRKHLRLSLWDLLTLWRPCFHFCVTLCGPAWLYVPLRHSVWPSVALSGSTSLCITLCGPTWLWVALHPSASTCVGSVSLLWTTSLFALSPTVPALPPPLSLPATDALLFLHPATLPLKLISPTWESIFLEILSICWSVSKRFSSLLLYFSCWWINDWD